MRFKLSKFAFDSGEKLLNSAIELLKQSEKSDLRRSGWPWC
jgi:hypothetical protein